MDSKLVIFWTQVHYDCSHISTYEFLCPSSPIFADYWNVPETRKMIMNKACEFLESEIGAKYRKKYRVPGNHKGFNILFAAKKPEFGVIHRQVRIDFVNWVMTTL